jgi:hypothetical protein
MSLNFGHIKYERSSFNRVFFSYGGRLAKILREIVQNSVDSAVKMLLQKFKY